MRKNVSVKANVHDYVREKELKGLAQQVIIYHKCSGHLNGLHDIITFTITS